MFLYVYGTEALEQSIRRMAEKRYKHAYTLRTILTTQDYKIHAIRVQAV